MMNIPETVGESSCKRQENGDASTGSERPLKKARFAWQVKGKSKYHMKNDTSDTKTSSSSPIDTEKPETSQNKGSTHDLVGNTEQNLEILGDYLLKQDFNTLDSVITDPDKSLLKPSTSISSEKLEYPRYVGSYDNNNGTRASSRDDMVAKPMSMLATQTYTEDQCIARWQARQMAKGFVDNTINRVLDCWMIAPLPADIGNRFLALDVAEFINNLPGDNSIENEGILMAISAHGLQNNSGSSSNDNSEEHTSSTKDGVFPSRSSSPLPSDDEKQNNNNQVENSCDNLNDLQMAWSYNDEKDINDSDSQFTFYPESSSSYLNYGENDNLRGSNIEFDDQHASFTSHYDFMDAAIEITIQNKGLTSFGTDYG